MSTPVLSALGHRDTYNHFMIQCSVSGSSSRILNSLKSFPFHQTGWAGSRHFCAFRRIIPNTCETLAHDCLPGARNCNFVHRDRTWDGLQSQPLQLNSASSHQFTSFARLVAADHGGDELGMKATFYRIEAATVVRDIFDACRGGLSKVHLQVCMVGPVC